MDQPRSHGALPMVAMPSGGADAGAVGKTSTVAGTPSVGLAAGAGPSNSMGESATENLSTTAFFVRLTSGNGDGKGTQTSGGVTSLSSTKNHRPCASAGRR